MAFGINVEFELQNGVPDNIKDPKQIAGYRKHILQQMLAEEDKPESKPKFKDPAERFRGK